MNIPGRHLEKLVLEYPLRTLEKKILKLNAQEIEVKEKNSNLLISQK